MLHGFEFEVLLVCCDGASENRKFISINSGYEGSLCKVYSYYSKLPMFFLSDPPHLVKKLRNNLSNSGDREDRIDIPESLSEMELSLCSGNILCLCMT